jgi:hypothetical protein
MVPSNVPSEITGTTIAFFRGVHGVILLSERRRSSCSNDPKKAVFDRRVRTETLAGPAVLAPKKYSRLSPKTESTTRLSDLGFHRRNAQVASE